MTLDSVGGPDLQSHQARKAGPGRHQISGPKRAARGLLARAEYYLLCADFAHARADLGEALALAERGSMRLHEADAHLGLARMHLAHSAAAAHLSQARNLIQSTATTAATPSSPS